MARETLLLDFDHVAFNTEDFKKELKPDFIPPNLDRFLYKDLKEFLGYAVKYADLVLFTEGDRQFQNTKLEGSKILTMAKFRDVIIMPSRTKPQEIVKLAKNYDGVLVLVDDRPDNVDAAIASKILAIRVRRGKYEGEETGLTPTYEVNSLRQIKEQNLLAELLTLKDGS